MSYLEGEYLQTNLPRCYCWRSEWRIPAATIRPEVRSRLDKRIDLPEPLSNLAGRRAQDMAAQNRPMRGERTAS